jgi:hypothetical protein
MARYLDEPALVPLHGRASRDLAEQIFDVRIVNGTILKAMSLSHQDNKVLHAVEEALIFSAT